MCETDTQINKVHHGRNIRHLRDLKGIKQETLADALDITQQSISEMEKKAIIDDEILEKVAKILDVPVEAIKNMTDETTFNYFNTFNNTDSSSAFGTMHTVTYSCHPIERITELHEEQKALYERMLKTEKEKNETLEKIINDNKLLIEKLLSK